MKNGAPNYRIRAFNIYGRLHILGSVHIFKGSFMLFILQDF